MNAVATATWTPSTPARSSGGGQSGTLTLIVLIATSLVMAAITATGSRGLVIAAAPAVLLAGLAAMFVGPIRLGLFFIIFFGLGIDALGDGPWDSPLARFGALMAYNLNVSMPLNVPMNGSLILMLLLVVIHAHRTLSGTGAQIDGRNRVPKELVLSLGVSAGAVFLLALWGANRGGDIQMAKIQVQHYLMMLLLAYLSAVGFRSVKDYRIVGRLIVIAACIKALMAVYVIAITVPRPEYATTHGDSVLFAAATVILLVRLAEQPSARTFGWCVLLLPIIGLGMQANDRRIVWVQIAVSLLMFWLVSRRTRAKRLVGAAMLAASPLLLAYIAVGWNSQASIFSPIQALRSTGAVGGNVDSSTLYRDTENYNLLLTLRYNQFLGAGFGQPFAEVVKLPDISFFKEYRYLPHNSILGLWAFTGAFGFTFLMAALVVAVFFASRSYAVARTAEERIAAFMVLAAVAIHLVHCWGDIGFSERHDVYIVGPAIGMAGHLAVATGAWRLTSPKRAVKA